MPEPRLDLPDSDEIPDLLQTESGSASDPAAVMHLAFRGEHIDALAKALDAIHLRDRLTGELLSASREGALRLSEKDRR